MKHFIKTVIFILLIQNTYALTCVSKSNRTAKLTEKTLKIYDENMKLIETIIANDIVRGGGKAFYYPEGVTQYPENALFKTEIRGARIFQGGRVEGGYKVIKHNSTVYKCK